MRDGVLAEQREAQRVEGAAGDLVGRIGPDVAPEPGGDLIGRLVGEGDRADPARAGRPAPG